MGYDLKRITCEVDEELKCGVCHQLLEDPVLLIQCDHIFCRKCLAEWMTTYLICPIDRQFIHESHVKCAPKLFQNFITKYDIRCDFADNGCKVTLKVDKLVPHVQSCPFRHGITGANAMAEEDQRLKALNSLEQRVKELEIGNQWIRRQLDDLKKQMDSGSDQSMDSIGCAGKLMIKIDDKSLVVDADPHEPIERIKQRVHELDGDIDGDQWLVYFAHQELDPKLTLSDYRICKPLPHLFLSMVRKKMRISLRIGRDSVAKVEVSPKHTIREVLSMALGEELLESKQFTVSYRNQKLDESRTLLSCKIRDGNYIFVNTEVTSL